MKLLAYLLIIILLAPLVVSEGIDIKLIQYEPESTLARIQIQNQESKSLRNLTLIIDDSEPYFLVGILSPGNAVVHSRNIPPGMHKVTVTTKEGITVTRDILFSKSREEIKKELNASKNQTTQKNEEPLKKEEIITKKKGKVWKALFFILLLLFMLFAIVFWYLYNKPSKQRPILPRPINVTPIRLREKSPEQIKREFEERARKRQEMLEKMMRK